jgi:Transposase DDE domain group 1
VHGGQQLALWNAHYDSRCFLPIHIYEATTGKPVAVILRPGKTPDGAEVALVLRHVIGRIRARWPAVEIIVRGDSHYGRPEAMAWCERQRVGYIFGLAGNPVLLRHVAPLAEDAALGRLASDKVRRYGDFRYAAKSWTVERRVIARVEAGPQGTDSRFIVTNLPGLPKALYEKLYCGRGQAENLIKALIEHGFRRSSSDGPTIVQEERHENPATIRASIGSPAPTRHPIRIGKATRDDRRGAPNLAHPAGQPLVAGRRHRRQGA